MFSTFAKRHPKVLLPIGVCIGFLVFVIANIYRPSPPLLESFDRAVLVDTLELKKQMASARVSGYGRVEPKLIWQAVAEVNGRVIYRNTQLETGRILPKGSKLLSIDSQEYQIKLEQAKEGINATQARLLRLDQEEKNLKSSVAIEKQKLDLSEREFQRKKELSERKLISNSDLDAQNSSLLAQRKLVQDLHSQMSLIPDDRKVNQAQLRVDQASLKDAERRLSQTEIILPFTARIGEVNVELDQVVNQGSVMLVAQNLGQVEIKAELSLKDMYTLVVSSGQNRLTPEEIPSIEAFNFKADVTLQIADIQRSWQATVSRIAETVNPDQATIGVYLEVEEDFRRLNPVIRPPLARGMLVTAFIESQPSPQFVVPEKTLHGKSIYIMTAERNLRIVPVEVLFRTKDGVAITGDIQEGQQLVLNDLIPAIDNMALRITTVQVTE